MKMVVVRVFFCQTGGGVILALVGDWDERIDVKLELGAMLDDGVEIDELLLWLDDSEKVRLDEDKLKILLKVEV